MRMNFSLLTDNNVESISSQIKQQTTNNTDNIKQNTKNNTKQKRTATRKRKYLCKTHDGHPLTPQEALFIDKYIELGNQRQAVIEAGYHTKNPGGYAYNIMGKEYISGEIAYRLKQLEEESIANAVEILQYFTSVMRGETKDQFGLEVPISERTRAAQELAKRKIDIPNRVNGKEQAQVVISLDWSGMEDTENAESETTE